MWAEGSRNALVFGLVTMAAATRPAEAAFLGPSGAIAYTSRQDGDVDIWRMAPDGFGAANLTESLAIDANPS